MKLRSLFVFGAGVIAGVTLARRMTADDPEVLHGPRDAVPANPAFRAVSDTAGKLADKATVASLEAIRRARGAIRGRLGDLDEYDEAVWN